MKIERERITTNILVPKCLPKGLKSKLKTVARGEAIGYIRLTRKTAWPRQEVARVSLGSLSLSLVAVGGRSKASRNEALCMPRRHYCKPQVDNAAESAHISSAGNVRGPPSAIVESEGTFALHATSFSRLLDVTSDPWASEPATVCLRVPLAKSMTRLLRGVVWLSRAELCSTICTRFPFERNTRSPALAREFRGRYSRLNLEAILRFRASRETFANVSDLIAREILRGDWFVE